MKLAPPIWKGLNPFDHLVDLGLVACPVKLAMIASVHLQLFSALRGLLRELGKISVLLQLFLPNLLCDSTVVGHLFEIDYNQRASVRDFFLANVAR